MNTKKILSWMAIPAMVLALSAHAHEPAEHNKKAEKPDCAAMSKMDHAAMNMKDPVMQAMMKKCMPDMHGTAERSTDGHDATEHDDEVSPKQRHRHDEKKH